ncbi:hypothetical protein FK220_009695 [Flavobacteriaceae bacterium TP-CH-4]|uniref:DUF8173 domain-containing protein n=1 Tax=Pelagihabitans pacificus TaxID=2696054 RepID=A0A967EDR6_9FLAO|nr:polymer-forming cytoskeletal protein [Pelagihabitans pacificus]NHF59613.1 hypothetical protein [Pelagihabitans pacificus]
MKTLILFLGLLFPLAAVAQYESSKQKTISEKQYDDLYRAGDTVNIDATVAGDVVIAGGILTVRDTVEQDLIMAGGEILVKGYVGDDIRTAGGTLTIDSEIGDDVIIAGGKVLLTENAVVHGNLINFSGDIVMNGAVKGSVRSYSGELEMNGTVGKGAQLYGEEITINGEIFGESKIAAEQIRIGNEAVFRDNVTYWSADSDVDFKNSLRGATASFSEELKGERDEFNGKGFGIAAIGFWIFYLLSALLVLLLLNWAFGDFFYSAVEYLENVPLKSFGYGLVYLFGVPVLILIAFIIVIGIPLGLFLAGFYLFSLLFGHLVTALLASHYLNKKSDGSWSFWTIVLLALGLAATLRLVTFIPFLGALLSMILIAIGYGSLAYTLLQKRALLKLGT